MELRRADLGGVNGVEVVLPSGKGLVIRHIIGIGLNYAEHAKEQGSELPEHPLVFTKNAAAACLNGDAIRIPRVCQDREQVDFEGELGVVIGTTVKDVTEGDVREGRGGVLGYVCANDVSARWWQKKGSGGQFCRGKGFDTFCPVGPRVVSAAEVGDVQKLRLVTRVNGQVMQDSTTGDMIFSVARLVSELSRGTTLIAGTLVLTGTPPGVGMARKPEVWLKGGDVVEVEIERIGVLRNVVEVE